MDHYDDLVAHALAACSTSPWPQGARGWSKRRDAWNAPRESLAQHCDERMQFSKDALNDA